MLEYWSVQAKPSRWSPWVSLFRWTFPISKTAIIAASIYPCLLSSKIKSCGNKADIMENILDRRIYGCLWFLQKVIFADAPLSLSASSHVVVQSAVWRVPYSLCANIFTKCTPSDSLAQTWHHSFAFSSISLAPLPLTITILSTLHDVPIDFG